MNIDVTDTGWWTSVITLLERVPVLGWAAILSMLAAVFLPLSVEYGLADEWRGDRRLPLYTFFGAIAVCISIAVLVAWPQLRFGLAIGLCGGAVCHFLRYMLARFPWFSWMRAKPRAEAVYDSAGQLRGVHVDGIDETVVVTRPQEKQP